jgi:hypothetical protein
VNMEMDEFRVFSKSHGSRRASPLVEITSRKIHLNPKGRLGARRKKILYYCVNLVSYLECRYPPVRGPSRGLPRRQNDLAAVIVPFFAEPEFKKTPNFCKVNG